MLRLLLDGCLAKPILHRLYCYIVERIDTNVPSGVSNFTFLNGGEISKSSMSRFKDCRLDAIDGFMFDMVMLPVFLVNCGFKCWHLFDFSTYSLAG